MKTGQENRAHDAKNRHLQKEVPAIVIIQVMSFQNSEGFSSVLKESDIVLCCGEDCLN